MGEMADALIEEQLDIYADHLNGHKCFRPDDCPYCLTEGEEETS